MLTLTFGEKTYRHNDDGTLEVSISKLWFSAGQNTGKFHGPGVSVHKDALAYARKHNLMIRILLGQTRYELHSSEWPDIPYLLRGHILMVAPIKMFRNPDKPIVKPVPKPKDKPLEAFFG